MRHFCSVLIGLAMATAAIVPFSQAQTTTVSGEANSNPSRYQLLGLTFETPLTFSAPAGSGEGVAVVYPPTAAPGEHEIMITLIDVLPVDSVLGRLSDHELRLFLRSTGLGSTPTSTPGMIERRILGRRLQGEVYFKGGERPIYQELYLVRLSTGNRMAIALEAEDRTPLALVEEVFSHVANSFAEIPPRTREWRRSFQWHKQNSAQR